MDFLEDTIMKIVADGEIDKGRIELTGTQIPTRYNGRGSILVRKIPADAKNPIYTGLTRLGLEYLTENYVKPMQNIMNGKSMIRRATEKEIIYFARTSEDLEKNRFVDSKDINKLIDTNYVKEREYLKEKLSKL